MPIYLINNFNELFVEIENHQVVLEDLLKNQSAGSFYDEITKWQNTLKIVEDVIIEWNNAQIKWQRIEPVSFIEIFLLKVFLCLYILIRFFRRMKFTPFYLRNQLSTIKQIKTSKY